MDIYILRDGKKIGPFSKDAAQILIKQGDVSVDDTAWQKGMTDWLTLGEVLGAAEQSEGENESTAATTPPPLPDEPVTATQIAFLTYFGVALPAGLQKADAERLITKCQEDPQNAKRLKSWEVDRIRLHPDLFNPEVRAKKEDRVQLFYDLCHTAGADHFTGVTKAHCQVLVTFLDLKYPRWDADQVDATERYFFPAIAEKFPQLVNKAWRGKLQYGEGLGATPKAARKSPTAKLVRRGTSPMVAVVRGVIIGLLILAVLYLFYASRQNAPGSRPRVEKAEGA